MKEDILGRSTPSAAGADARGLLRFLDALDADPGIRPHGLVVLRDGLRIAEGWWAPYTADRVQLLYSVSKSFTATAVGLARDEGLIDLDATVLSYFPELDADITDSRSRAMTVRHVAAMASGHAGETIDLAERRDPGDLVRGFLLVPPDAEPGTVFAYNQPCTYALGAIVRRVSGLSLLDYLRPRLFEPLGIDDVSWLRDRAGHELGFSGLHATTDAVARLGELYRRGGRWGERRIVSEEWVALATTAHIETPHGWGADWEQGYGFQFWRSRHGYRADGAYGQLSVVVPEAGLVVALTAETERVQQVLDAIWEHVLPAIGAPADADDDAVLAARLAALVTPVPARPGEPTWSGERSFAVERPGDTTVTAVRVTPTADGGRVAFEDDGGSLDIPFGLDEWRSVENAGVPVAAAGAWGEDGTLTVEMLFLETPHTLRLHCSATAGTASLAWVTAPLHDRRPSAQHRP